MTDTIDIHEILERYQDSRDALRPLHDTMEKYYKKWWMEPYVPKDTTYQAYTSNKMRTDANKVMSWLASSTLNISVAIDNQTTPKLEKAATCERYVWGSLYQQDRRLISRNEPKLMYQLIWYGCVFGWWACMPLVYKGEDGETHQDITPINPRWLYYERGHSGPLWHASVRYTTQRALQKEYDEYKENVPKPTYGEELAVLNYWDDDVNAVIMSQNLDAGDSFTGEFIKPPKDHGIGHDPIKFGPVGLTPYITMSSSKDTIKDMGDSVFTANMGIDDNLNKLLSWTMDLIGQNVKQGHILVNFTPEQADDVGDLNRTGGHTVIDSDQDIRSVDKNRMPADTGPMLGQVGQDLQHGGLSSISYGETKGQVSGYLASQLNRSTEDTLVTRNSALEDF